MTLLLIVNGFQYSEVIYDNTILKLLESQRDTLESVIGLVEEKVIKYYRGVMDKLQKDVIDRIIPVFKGIVLGEMLKPSEKHDESLTKGSVPLSRATPKERSERVKEKLTEVDSLKDKKEK